MGWTVDEKSGFDRDKPDKNEYRENEVGRNIEVRRTRHADLIDGATLILGMVKVITVAVRQDR